MRQLGYKNSKINKHSPFAEREITLTEIDSMFQNGEINEKEARDMVVQWAVDTNNVALLPTLIGGK